MLVAAPLTIYLCRQSGGCDLGSKADVAWFKCRAACFALVEMRTALEEDKNINAIVQSAGSRQVVPSERNG